MRVQRVEGWLLEIIHPTEEWMWLHHLVHVMIVVVMLMMRVLLVVGDLVLQVADFFNLVNKGISERLATLNRPEKIT